MSNPAIKVAVIGLGRWGPNHVRVFSGMENVQMVAVADRDEGACQRFQEKNPKMECVLDYQEILNNPEVSAVIVATPTVTHSQIVQEALLARKHVLCEKPLAANSNEAWQLVALAEQCQRILMVGHVFLFNPGVDYLGRLVREQTLGPLYYISATRTNLGPFRRDVNAAWDLASHDIYIFNHLLEERPLWVSAAGGSYLRQSVEDLVFLTLQYPGGVLGHIHVSWLDPKKVRQITMVGERKMVSWDEFGTPGPVMVYERSVAREPQYGNFGEFQLLAREGDVIIPRIVSAEPLGAQARAFIQRCANGLEEKDVRGSSRQGAEVVDVLMMASLSLKEGGRRVEISYGA